MDGPLRAPSIDDLVNRWLGNYQLVEIIGRGGMAVVYKALQPALRRHVAIKVLPPYLVHTPGFRERFAQEAATVARLEHPHILSIYDYGQQDDVPYIVSPLVPSGTLQTWLALEPPLESVIEVLGQVLDALHYAHEQNVIHRDLKPSNVLMRASGWPLLSDFGTAKLLEPSSAAQNTHSFIGTPAYMAPEQSQGAQVGPATDLYAMGIIVYQVLTGRLPFEGPTPAALLIQHIRDDVVPPSLRNSAIGPVWDTVIRRSLAKLPAERYASAGDMKAALLAAIGQRGAAGEPLGNFATADIDRHYARARQAFVKGQWPLVLSLCEQILRQRPGHHAASLLLNEAKRGLGQSRLPTAEHVGDRQWSIERERADVGPVRETGAAAAAPGGGPEQVVVRHPAEGSLRLAPLDPTTPLPPPPRLEAPPTPDARASSARGQLVCVLNRQESTVMLLDATTLQPVQRIQVGASPLGLAVHPSGAWLYVVTRAGNRLQAFSLRDGRELASVAVGAGPHAIGVAPNGARVYVANRFADSVSVIDAASNQVVDSLAVGRAPVALAVHPMGTRLYVACTDNDSVAIVDTAEGVVVATSRPAGLEAPEALAVHPDGSRVYVAGARSDTVATLEAQGGRVVALATVPSGPCGVAVDPFGTRVYVACWDSSSLAVLDATTGQVTGTLPLEAAPRGIAVQPDGRRLYLTARAGHSMLVLDTATLQPIATVPVGNGPHAIVLA